MLIIHFSQQIQWPDHTASLLAKAQGSVKRWIYEGPPFYGLFKKWVSSCECWAELGVPFFTGEVPVARNWAECLACQ